ncbi:transmembrane protein 125 [Polymixia lowei]
MPELEDFRPLQGSRGSGPGPNGQADPAQIQHSILEEQVELWWFREPGKSLLCYCVAVLLILGCGLGGVGLLSTTTSVSSEWRLGAGTALCLLALGVLLKQLLSSAVQDMNCVRSRRRIDILKSGGLSDLLVVLITGLSLLICGAVLLRLALANHMPKPGQALNDMYISGVVLLAGGGAAVLGVGVYAAFMVLLERTRQGRRLMDRVVNIFTVSGHMDHQARRETTSSLANLI